MEHNNLIDMNCEHQKFCTSWYTIKVCEVGACLAVDAWNNHKIPGRYIIITYVYCKLLAMWPHIISSYWFVYVCAKYM